MEVFRQMVVKKIAKRIAALGTGAVLVGSSIMGASAAADLGMYPSQYIKDGKFTGVMVVGDNAKAEDVIGVSDIATSMQAAAVKKVSSGGSSVSADGEAWQVKTSTDNLELTESLTTGTNDETIGDIVSQSFIDEAELPELLTDGEVSNSKGTSPYNQLLYFEQTGTGYVKYIESSTTDVTADHLVFDNGEQLARYELEFTSSFESDQDGTNLEDYEDAELTMLGQTYSIVTATSASNGKVVLTLMGGSNRDTMLEGATKTYNIDGKDYEVTLTYVDTDEAQFQVNGQTTQKLEDGETDKLSDGTTIGVSEILYQDYAGGIHSATFFLGAQKMVLTDTNITVNTGAQEIEVDDENIDGLVVNIEGTDDDTTFKIDSIVVNMTADDTYYVPAGGKLSENPDLEEADLLFTRSWDIEYTGLSTEDTTMIAVTSAGDDDYELEFVDGSGNEVKVPFVHATASAVTLGDSDQDLFVTENSTIGTSGADDFFVVTDYTETTDGERQSYVLRYKSSDKIINTDGTSTDSPKITFEDVGSGQTIERTLSITTNSLPSTFIDSSGANGTFTEVAQLKIGGGTFRIYNLSTVRGDDFNIYVDMDGQDDDDGGETINGVANSIAINSKDGARIAISENTANGIILNISTPNADDTDDLTATPIIYNISADASAELSMAENSNLVFTSPEGDDDNDFTYTAYGAWVKQSNPSSSPDELWVEYPVDQRVPQVFITGEGVTFTDSAASEGDSVVVQKIQVGATKLASEVTDIKAVSSILVGGPCANAAAATVMGNPADCTEGFEPGVGMVKMYDVGNGNVAMLVAGYSALDTRNAAQVVSNYKSYAGSLKGTAVEVKKVNNQLTVAQPAPKAAMVEETEEEATEETA